MRKHLVRYIHDVENASKIRAALMNSKRRDEIVYYIELLRGNRPNTITR